MNDNVRTKFLVFLASVVFVGIVVLLYFIDQSRGWDAYKTISCVVINLWIFFLLPSLRSAYLQCGDLAEWFKKGMDFGAGGIVVPVLLAPYYGFKYYICSIKSDSNE